MPSKLNHELSGKHQLFVNRQGTGEPVVLLHGLLGSHSYWDEVVKHISGAKYEVIVPDLLGFGQSDKPKDLQYRIEDHVAAIEKEVLADIKTPVTLVGHSMGAMIALRLAARNPDRVKTLILVNLPIFSDPKHAGQTVKRALGPFQRVYASRVGIVLYGMRNNFLKTLILQSVQGGGSELPNKVAADYTSHNWQSFKRSLVNVIINHSTHADLGESQIKTKFIYSRNDPFLTPAALEVIEGLSHFERIELDGKHRLPIEQAQRIALEICS